MKNNLTYKITLTALLSAFATIAFLLESLFPPLFIPGARMGLSNVFILLTVYLIGGRYAIAALVVKTVIGSLFSGNVSSLMYSLPSGLVALGLELALIYLVKKVSTLCVSVTGAVINTTLQNLTFCLVTGTSEYLGYLPYLALVGVISGAIVGVAVYLILLKAPTKNKNNQAVSNTAKCDKGEKF